MPTTTFFGLKQKALAGLICSVPPGLDSSSSSAVLYSPCGKYCLVPALDSIYVWSLDSGMGRSQDLVHIIRDQVDEEETKSFSNKNKVTFMQSALVQEAYSALLLAVGHEDGTVQVWDVTFSEKITSVLRVVFKGHRSPITAMAFSPSLLSSTSKNLAPYLVTGARDADLVVWDLNTEAGKFRLRGHTASITHCTFLENVSSSSSHVLSASRDGMIKVWHVETQLCLETIQPGVISNTVNDALTPAFISSNLSVTGVAILPDNSISNKDEEDENALHIHCLLLFVTLAEGDPRLLIFRLDMQKLSRLMLPPTPPHANNKEKTSLSSTSAIEAITDPCFTFLGAVERCSKERVLHIEALHNNHIASFTPSMLSSAAFAILSSDKSVQVFRTRSAEEIKKKMARRKKRVKSKLKNEEQNTELSSSLTATFQASDLIESICIVRCKGKAASLSHRWTVLRKEKEKLLMDEKPDFSSDNEQDALNPKKRSKKELKETKIESLKTRLLDSLLTPRIDSCLKLLLNQTNNTLVEYSLILPKETEQTLLDYSITSLVHAPGHRLEMKAVAVSMPPISLASPEDRILDDQYPMIATASDESVKLWRVVEDSNSAELALTLDDFSESAGIPSAMCFVQDGKYLVIGFKEGALVMFNAQTGDMVSHLPGAHDKPITGIFYDPCSISLFTCSFDQSIKQFKLKQRSSSPNLSLKHSKTLIMPEAVLTVQVSPDGKFLACALMDMTVKVFHLQKNSDRGDDSLPLPLQFNLYGHKLPATCLAFSQDGRVLASAGADKSIKLWSMEHGDLKRSLMGHEAPITGIRFVTGGTGHDIVSCSRDGTLRQWTPKGGWQCLQVVHVGTDLLALDMINPDTQLMRNAGVNRWISGQGIDNNTALDDEPARDLIVTIGADRSIRTFTPDSRDQIFLSELEERRLDALIDVSVQEQIEANTENDTPGHPVSLATSTSLKDGERLLEALNEADQHRYALDMWRASLNTLTPLSKPSLPPMFIATRSESPEDLVWWAVERIKSANLEQAILCLPYATHVRPLLMYIKQWLEKKPSHLIPVSRLAILLTRTFFVQISAPNDPETIELIRQIQESMTRQLYDLKDKLYYNTVWSKLQRRRFQGEKLATLLEDTL